MMLTTLVMSAAIPMSMGPSIMSVIVRLSLLIRPPMFHICSL
jgi:hypothetical protein